MNYIGVDCHNANLNFAVMNETGRIIQETAVPTSGKNFIKFIQCVAKPRKIYIEEGEMAAWLLELCISFNEKLIIADPKENKWIAKSKRKNDKVDARKLASLARGGYIKEIYHLVGSRRRFKELVMSYHDTVKTTTMLKNKIKAKFRQNGIPCKGETVYNKTYRDDWKKKLPDEAILHFILKGLWNQLDEGVRVKEEILKQITIESQKYPEIKRFKKLPGIGFIRAATISAIIACPHRFKNKRKLWMYAGLAIVESESGGKVYSKRLTIDYNRQLKNTIKQAAQNVTRGKDNHFRKQYLRLVIEEGKLPHRAVLTVARSMLATIYGMWKNNEEYKPEKREDRQGKNNLDK